MKKNWQGTLSALALLVACVMGCDPPRPVTTANENSATTNQPTADIAGNYGVAGTNEDGSPYKGLLEVIKRGDVYQFRWNAGKQYDGIGVPNANFVAVAFTEGSDGKGCGVVNYKILDDGSLDGKWGYWGLNESGTEKATSTGVKGLAGDYNLVGKNPDGKEYKGTVSIAHQAGGYTFAWSNGSTGFGVQRANNVSVGVGGSKCAFVAYEIKPDGLLDGVWGGYGSSKTGTEKATKK